MPQKSPATLKVAENVEITFTPRPSKDGVATFVKSSGVPIGDQRMTLGFTRSNNKVKAELRFVMPVVTSEDVGGAVQTKLTRTAYANLALSFDTASTRAERDQIYFLIQTALANPMIGGSLFGLEELY